MSTQPQSNKNKYVLKQQVNADSVMIPRFLNLHTDVDSNTFDLMQRVFQIVSDLIQDRFISDAQMNLLYFKADRLLESLVNRSRKEIIIELHLYLIDMINSYIEYAEDNEMYEIASNITKFKNNVFKYVED